MLTLNCLTESCLLHYFDPNLETEVICDASPFGLCATLVQIKDKEKRIIEYASRTLNKTEQKYGQIEREALSILFGCLKYQIYVLGCRFTVITDHLPLLSCFNNPKSQMPYRVERVRMKLMGFDFVVKHCSGKQNISDFLSRNSISNEKISKEEKEIEHHIHSLIITSYDCVSLDEIRKAVSEDDILCELKSILQHERTINTKDKKLGDFVKIFKELYLVDELIMRKNKIVIPAVLRMQILQTGHDGHQGIVKTKQLLRSKYWWPGMDAQIQRYIENCRPCQASVLQNEKEPLKMTSLPDGPWENLATDFHGPLPSGEHLLVVIDEYSRFPVVEIVTSTSHKAAIPKFDKIFAEFGIPKRLKSDNGAPFNGDAFAKFAKFLGFYHHRITPLHPESNGLVEKFNTGLEKIIHTANIESKNWRQELHKYLRNYRATPQLTTNESPANLLFQKRNFRTRLPELPIKIDDDDLRKTDAERKRKIKFYADQKKNIKFSNIDVGDTVLLKIKRDRKSDPYYDPNPYRVIERKGNMIIAERGQKTVTRNTSFFKKIPSTVEFNDDMKIEMNDTIDSDDDDLSAENEQRTLRRSTRVTGQPVRYPMDVLQ